MNNKQYTPYDKFPVDEVRFTMGQDRTNKTTINMSVGAMSASSLHRLPRCSDEVGPGGR